MQIRQPEYAAFPEGPALCNPYCPVLNSEGIDIRPLLEDVSAKTEVPLELLLACAIAESGLDPQAERWGIHTAEACRAIAGRDWTTLAWIIGADWPDIGFGYGVQLVLFHYLGDYAPTVENCLAVRRGVFAHPEGSVLDMGRRLFICLQQVSGTDLKIVNDQAALGALVLYRTHRFVRLSDIVRQRATALVDTSTCALQRARELLDQRHTDVSLEVEVTRVIGPRTGVGALTQREREILDLVARGLANKAIAKELCLSRSTVQHHLSAIYTKLGCGNRMQAALCILHAETAEQTREMALNSQIPVPEGR